jgi:putative sigma-54 modulation protein
VAAKRLRSFDQGADSVQIQISTRHGHVSDATQEKIRSKVERLNRYFERLTTIEVTLDVEHPEAPAVDVRVSAEHKHDFVATAKAENLLAAVDAVVEKMEQQLRKYKERVQDRHRNTGTHEQEVP